MANKRRQIGITDETRTQGLVKFPIEKYWKEYKADQRDNPFCEGGIVEVSFKPRVDRKGYKLKDGVTKPKKGDPITQEMVLPESRVNVIQFIFKSEDGVFTHIEDFFGLKDADPKFVTIADLRLPVNLSTGVSKIVAF